MLFRVVAPPQELLIVFDAGRLRHRLHIAALMIADPNAPNRAKLPVLESFYSCVPYAGGLSGFQLPTDRVRILHLLRASAYDRLLFTSDAAIS